MKKLMIAGIWCLCAIPSLLAEERYFVVLFASQGAELEVRRTHTFATFLKLDIGAPDEDGEIPTETMETATISWLPASGVIRVVARPETGKNFDLKESLAWAKQQGVRTTARGPFEISKEFYDRALRRKELLESGKVAYKVLDRRYRPDTAVNCVHAVSDLAPGPLLLTGSARGDSATDLVMKHFRPHLADAERVHVWAMRHLELNGEPIVMANDSGKREMTTPLFTE